MRIIKTSAALPTDTLGQLALYAGMDCLSLYEIRDALKAELCPVQQATYEFEMDLQSALIEMSFNGIPIDPGKRAHMTSVFQTERTMIEGHLHKFCEAIGYYDYYLTIAKARFAPGILLPSSWEEWLALPLSERRALKAINPQGLDAFHKALKSGPFNANSVQAKLQLFYHFFGSPDNFICREHFPDFLPPWNKTRGITEIKGRKANNEYGPTTDRDALDKLLKRALDADERDAVYWAQPFISCCLAIADYTKALGFLQCPLENGVFRYSFGAITETGRLASSRNAQGYGWNAQNISPRLRGILTTPPGWKAATPDYEQIESRNVAAICYVLFGATRYLLATECGDLHTLVCSMIWEKLAWPEEFNFDYVLKYGKFPPDMLRAAKAIAEVKFYRHFSYRDLSKRGGHGSNYLGKAPHMAKMLHIDVALMQHYQDAYFTLFPEIKQWHQWTIEQVQVHQEITTIFGRRRQFLGRPSDDATIREAVAYSPQSMAADYTNRALLAMHKAILRGELPARIFLQKHDELGFRFLESDQDAVLPKAIQLMEQHIPITSPSGETRDWYIPVEAQLGWNLGYASEDNPDGLIKWKGSDTRIRQRNPFGKEIFGGAKTNQLY